jgi:hypothetical protein
MVAAMSVSVFMGGAAGILERMLTLNDGLASSFVARSREYHLPVTLDPRTTTPVRADRGVHVKQSEG